MFTYMISLTKKIYLNLFIYITIWSTIFQGKILEKGFKSLIMKIIIAKTKYIVFICYSHNIIRIM